MGLERCLSGEELCLPFEDLGSVPNTHMVAHNYP